MEEHTRGPLAVVDYDEPVPLTAAECQFSVQSHEAPIAYIYRREDADLFAAAPDLFAALEGLIAVCEPNIYPQPDKPDSSWAKLQSARAAIAQAKGSPQ